MMWAGREGFVAELGMEDFGGTVTAGVNREFEAADFKTGKDGLGGIIIDAQHEQVASAAKLVFVCFKDDFAGEAVVITEDAEGCFCGIGTSREVFAEYFGGIPEVNRFFWDFGFKTFEAQLSEVDAVGAIEGKGAGTLPEEVFCGKLAKGEVVDSDGGDACDF
jgi:hypothetical protein